MQDIRPFFKLHRITLVSCSYTLPCYAVISVFLLLVLQSPLILSRAALDLFFLRFQFLGCRIVSPISYNCLHTIGPCPLRSYASFCQS